jgi:hypothetical protein
MSREFRLKASLALNLILVLTVMALVRHKSERAPAPLAREVNQGIIIDKTPLVRTETKLPQYANLASATERRRWLVDELRAAGVPNNVIARMVMSELDETWEKRFAEVALNSHGNPDALAALHLEQERETEAQMRAALGEAGFKQWDEEHLLREANIGNTQLTAAEADAIYDLKKKLQQRRWDLQQARVDGEMDEAEIDDATDKAYSEFNRQMKTLLGDERYAASQGLNDGVANLQQDLAKVNPSGPQFQDLLKAQQQFNERRSDLDKQFQENPSSPDYAVQLKALDDARDQEYQRVLGTNIFDTFQKEQDIGYSKMKKYENIWGLDDNKIDYVYGTIRYYEKSVRDYQAQAKALESQGQSVDWDAAKKNLQQFAQQTQQTLQSYLGADSFNKMQRNGVFQFSSTSQSGQIQ